MIEPSAIGFTDSMYRLTSGNARRLGQLNQLRTVLLLISGDDTRSIRERAQAVTRVLQAQERVTEQLLPSQDITCVVSEYNRGACHESRRFRSWADQQDWSEEDAAFRRVWEMATERSQALCAKLGRQFRKEDWLPMAAAHGARDCFVLAGTRDGVALVRHAIVLSDRVASSRANRRLH